MKIGDQNFNQAVEIIANYQSQTTVRFNLRASRIAYRFHKIRETDVIVGTAMLCDENLF